MYAYMYVCTYVRMYMCVCIIFARSKFTILSEIHYYCTTTITTTTFPIHNFTVNLQLLQLSLHSFTEYSILICILGN